MLLLEVVPEFLYKYFLTLKISVFLILFCLFWYEQFSNPMGVGFFVVVFLSLSRLVSYLK